MPYRNTIEALYANINEVEQIVSRFGTERTIPKIEIDIALGKMRQAYDMLLTLRDEDTMHPVHQPKAKSAPIPTPTDEPPTYQPTDMAETPATEEHFEFEMEPEASQAMPNNVVETTPSKPTIDMPVIKNETVPATKPGEQATLSDKFNTGSGTLNQKLIGNKQGADLASKLNLKPLANIPSAIGINEKFEIMNTLFGGDKSKYDETIQRIDTAGDFDKAINIIQNEFEWDMESPLAQRIIELAHRRFNIK